MPNIDTPWALVCLETQVGSRQSYFDEADLVLTQSHTAGTHSDNVNAPLIPRMCKGPEVWVLEDCPVVIALNPVLVVPLETFGLAGAQSPLVFPSPLLPDIALVSTSPQPPTLWLYRRQKPGDSPTSYPVSPNWGSSQPSQ